MTDATTTPAAEPTTARLALTLAFAGVVSGLVLVGVYEMTAPVIAANRAEALRVAVLEVLPGATRMERREDGDEAVYAGYDDSDSLVGYAVPAQGPGFQDTIRLIFGYSPSKDRIVGMAILESKETPGLGDKIYKDQAFLSQFEDLGVEPEVTPVKPGTRSKVHEVDTISGATISAKAVCAIINTGLQRWLEHLRTAEKTP